MALCKERNVTLTLHFKGSFNQRTKRLIKSNQLTILRGHEPLPRSHGLDKNSWKFNSKILEGITSMGNLPPPTFDCFASFNNKETALYCSKSYDLISPFWDFTANISSCKVPKDQIFWANHPFENDIISKTLSIFLKHNLKGYILSPMIPQLAKTN